MLENIAMLFDEDEKKDQDGVGFLREVRLAPPKQKQVAARRPPKKKGGDEHLSYNSRSPDTLQGL